MNAQEPLPFPRPDAATVFDALVCLHCGARFLACVCFEGEVTFDRNTAATTAACAVRRQLSALTPGKDPDLFEAD